jgi:hypothetical protein
MTDDQVKATLRNMLRVLGRHGDQLAIVGEMNKRELSRGVILAGQLHHLAADVEEWLGHAET